MSSVQASVWKRISLSLSVDDCATDVVSELRTEALDINAAIGGSKLYCHFRTVFQD
jgi:hypothetical protein